MKKILGVTVSTVAGATLMLGLAPQAEAATSIRVKALSIAAGQKNDPWVSGATGPNAFDCSGLVKYSFGKAGKWVPRTAQQQYNASKKLSWQSRTKGDLVAIGTSTGHITHVGLYAGYWSGKAWMWNANTGSYRGKKVVLAPINEYLGGGRHAYYGRFN